MNHAFPYRREERLAIAALSARSLATQAAAEGFAPHALDVFGDADTRASASWRTLSAAGRIALDADLLHGALHALAARGDCAGWIAGSGFEMQLDLLESAAAVLPLIGNRPAVVRQSRAPARLYPLLAALGVPHPETRLSPPPDSTGWLLKNAQACGGWHVRRAPTAIGGMLQPGAYFQREVPGIPMSVLFLADRQDAVVLGIAEQRVRPVGRRRWVFHGGFGPVSLPTHVDAEIADWVRRITSALGLVGLNGIDFMLDGDSAWVIELNARPTAAVGLFADALPAGLVRAHVATWRGASVSRFAVLPTRPRGFEVLFARAPGRVDATLHAALRRAGWCADIPMPGTAFARGDPLCTVFAEGESRVDLEERLTARIAKVRGWLAAAAAAAVDAAIECHEAEGVPGDAS